MRCWIKGEAHTKWLRCSRIVGRVAHRGCAKWFCLMFDRRCRRRDASRRSLTCEFPIFGEWSHWYIRRACMSHSFRLGIDGIAQGTPHRQVLRDGRDRGVRWLPSVAVWISVVVGAFGEFLVVPTATLLECAVVWTRNAPLSVFKVRMMYTLF